MHVGAVALFEDVIADDPEPRLQRPGRIVLQVGPAHRGLRILGGAGDRERVEEVARRVARPAPAGRSLQRVHGDVAAVHPFAEQVGRAPRGERTQDRRIELPLLGGQLGVGVGKRLDVDQPFRPQSVEVLDALPVGVGCGNVDHPRGIVAVDRDAHLLADVVLAVDAKAAEQRVHAQPAEAAEGERDLVRLAVAVGVAVLEGAQRLAVLVVVLRHLQPQLVEPVPVDEEVKLRLRARFPDAGKRVDMAVRRLHRPAYFRPVLQDAVQVRRPLFKIILERPEDPLRRVGEDVRRIERLVHEEGVRIVARGEQQVLLLLVRLLLDLAPLDVNVGLLLHHVEELQSFVRVGLVGDHRHHLQGDLLGGHRIAGIGIDVGGRHPGLFGGAGKRPCRSHHDQHCHSRERANLLHGLSSSIRTQFSTPYHGHTGPSSMRCADLDLVTTVQAALRCCHDHAP